MDLIQLVEDRPGHIGGYRQNFFGILYRLVHLALTPLMAPALLWFQGSRCPIRVLLPSIGKPGRSTTGWH